jgi:hypothetical protein
MIGILRPPLGGDRHRRATRECLLAIAAVEELLDTVPLARDEVAGSGTALLYATTSAYAASNRSFIEGSGGTLHFPYTAPSAVPAEVAIEFRLSGPYLIFLGGAAAAIDALWFAGTLLDQGACVRALVLAVETFEACADLYACGRWLMKGPLVEAAACALLLPGGPGHVYSSMAADRFPTQDAIRQRAGETLACAPLIALAMGEPKEPRTLGGLWRGRLATLSVSGGGPSVGAPPTYNREAF